VGIWRVQVRVALEYPRVTRANPYREQGLYMPASTGPMAEEKEITLMPPSLQMQPRPPGKRKSKFGLKAFALIQLGMLYCMGT
jgi:hypothetical protein